MAARSLRAHLLRILLPPITALLAVGAVIAYYPSIQPAKEAYDQALVDIGLALGAHVRVTPDEYRFEIPPAVEQVLRTDRYDSIFFRVLSPGGLDIAGDPALPLPEGDQMAFYARYNGKPVRVVSVHTPCGRSACTVLVAETTVKRERLARDILLQSLFPEALIAVATLVLVWFGVKRGLWPLAKLSEEIKARSPRDLRPVNVEGAPEETRGLVTAMNGLLEEVAQAAQNQQRFLANAAHQLRTPLAGLQAHTELALAQPMPEKARAQIEQVHRATVRTARLANQLLALARAEKGGRVNGAPVNLNGLIENEADDWLRQAMARDVDLGFELEPASVRGDAFLLREALANLVHNAIEYSPSGARVTIRAGKRNGGAYVEVEDDGPGIPPPERERVMERFYRMPGTPGTGSGLGLAIVRDIAAGHGAGVEIADGSGGRGVRVALTFPHG
ncbi:MAG TPA: sensor histidine kinase N-terminal domain-containing protein [Burkholderiales bacterium]|nr:sensor histidine kinase N-terminal domain-containing protein [Burkholderiales bacterium]